MFKLMLPLLLLLVSVVFNKYGAATHDYNYKVQCNLTVTGEKPVAVPCNETCQLQILRHTKSESTSWLYEVTCQTNCTPGYDYVTFQPEVLQTNCCSLHECSWDIFDEEVRINGFAVAVPKDDVSSSSRATPTQSATPTLTTTRTPIPTATPSSAPPDNTRLSNLEEFANKVWSLPKWVRVLVPVVIYSIDITWLLLLLYACRYSHKQKKKMISRNRRCENQSRRNEIELQSQN